MLSKIFKTLCTVYLNQVMVAVLSSSISFLKSICGYQVFSRLDYTSFSIVRQGSCRCNCKSKIDSEQYLHQLFTYSKQSCDNQIAKRFVNQLISFPIYLMQTQFFKTISNFWCSHEMSFSQPLPTSPNFLLQALAVIFFKISFRATSAQMKF